MKEFRRENEKKEGVVSKESYMYMTAEKIQQRNSAKEWRGKKERTEKQYTIQSNISK